jgi:hypothetical protein
MHFSTKSYLKSNHNHITKQTGFFLSDRFSLREKLIFKNKKNILFLNNMFLYIFYFKNI